MYEVDPNLLDPKNTTVFLHKSKDWGDETDEYIFLEYNPEELDQYTEIPESTLAYYDFAHRNKKRSLQFHLVPHIFYKGEIDTRDLKVIET